MTANSHQLLISISPTTTWACTLMMQTNLQTTPLAPPGFNKGFEKQVTKPMILPVCLQIQEERHLLTHLHLTFYLTLLVLHQHALCHWNPLRRLNLQVMKQNIS